MRITIATIVTIIVTIYYKYYYYYYYYYFFFFLLVLLLLWLNPLQPRSGVRQATVGLHIFIICLYKVIICPL